MEHIVVRVQPFVLEQEILIYKNGECIDRKLAKMRDLEEEIALQAKLYNIKDIDLTGTKIFTERIKTRLSQNKFNLDLNITVY